MATLVAGEKARMYAIGGVARGGATRGGYHSTLYFVSIAGVQRGAARAVAGLQVDDGSLTISDILDNTPNTAAMVCRGFVPALGADVIITAGSIHTLVREFGGIILSKDDGYVGTPANGFSSIRCIEYGWLASQLKVSGRYTNTSASVIAAALLPLGFTGRNIQPGLPFVDTFQYTNQDVNSVLTQLARRIGAYWSWDYFKDLHFFITDTTLATDPLPLTATHKSLLAFLATTDLSQIVTRCFVEGGGVTCLALLAPGETILPLSTSAWYPEGGGLVVSNGQRLTYTGVQAGGGGALVGLGGGPSVAPSMALVAGAGLGVGVYQYAYTDVTAAGESLPSPLGSVTTIAATPLADPVFAIGQFAGSSLQQVDSPANFTGTPPNYDVTGNPPHIGDNTEYSYSWSTAVGTPSDVTHDTHIAPSSGLYVALTILQALGYGSFIVPKGVSFYIPTIDPNATYVHVWRRRNGGAWTLIATWPGPLTAGFVYGSPYQQDSLPDLGTTALSTANAVIPAKQQVNLSGIGTGPAAVTARKVYRTVANGTQLKLLTTIADNTTETFHDAVADGSLGANAPIADTSGLAFVPGQVQAGSTTMFVSSAAPFVNAGLGGWVLLSSGEYVRYSGVGGIIGGGGTFPNQDLLLGIPATGPGSIRTTVLYGSQVRPVPAISGIPASGAGSIQFPILAGDPVNILAQVDDTPAQAALSALLDPSNVYGGARGIQEDYLTDGTIGYIEAHARGQAELALRKLIDVKVTYTVGGIGDQNTRAGRSIVVNLPLQGIVNQTFKILQVDQAGHTPKLLPAYTVQAGSRFSFEDLLRGFGG